MPAELGSAVAKLQVVLEGNAKRLNSTLRMVEGRISSLQGLAAKAGLAIGEMLGMYGVGSLFSRAIRSASDLNETTSKFEVVFGRNTEAMKAWGDAFAKQVGRSRVQVRRFLSEAQDLFIPLGFDPKQAEAMSKSITELALDLASFNNKADADVFRDLQAALTGSSEVMKKYGVVVGEAAVKQELLNQGLNPNNVTNAQKVMARFNIILRGTKAAQGDVIRTSDQYANRVKKFHATVSNAFSTIGTNLLPVMNKVLEAVIPLVEAVGEGIADWAKKANKSGPVLSNMVLSIAGFVAKIADGLALMGQGLMSLKILATDGIEAYQRYASEVRNRKTFSESLDEFRRRFERQRRLQEKADKTSLEEAQKHVAEAEKVYRQSLQRLAELESWMGTETARRWNEAQVQKFLRDLENARETVWKAKKSLRETKEILDLVGGGKANERENRLSKLLGEMPSQAALSWKSLAKSIDEVNAKLREQVNTFGMTGVQAQIYQLQKKGAEVPAEFQEEYNAKLEETYRLAKRLEELEAGQRAAEEAKARMEELKSRAQSLTESLMTPLEKWKEEMKDIQMLWERELISEETFVRATKELERRRWGDIESMAQGTFAARGLSGTGSSAINRTARATEETAKNTKDIRKSLVEGVDEWE